MTRRPASVLCTLLVAGLLLAASASSALAAAPGIRVSGNQLVDDAGTPLHVGGVNRSGTEYACAQGWGIFDGPSDDASITAMTAWGINAVRVPLNEDCWLGINGVNATYGGAGYRSAIVSDVGRLEAHGLDVILDLHWGAAGGQLALGQEQAPDADHAVAFWSSVATTFKAMPGVAYDLFNEPHDISWSCWRNGCTTPGGWAATGMQQLVNAVRATGSTQPVIAEGLNWGGDLSGWLANAPTDPAGQLVAGWHIYNYSGCNTIACWNSTVAPVAARVPVLATEVGETDCGGTFLGALLPWADAHGIGYLAWAWNTAACSAPSLITDYSGTPTAFGAAFRTHLAQRGSLLPPDPQARFDFEDGTSEGWQVAWGSDLTVANETAQAWSGAHGLGLDLTGAGYPAATVAGGLTGLTPGSRVTLHVWAPAGVDAGLSPVLFDPAWHVMVLATQTLSPGWNAVSFVVPGSLSGVRELGVQLDDPDGWTGQLALDDIGWSTVHFDFESGSAQGWADAWGAGLAVSAETGTAFTGAGGLALDVSGPGYPAVGVTSGLGALTGGDVVCMEVWAPTGVVAQVAPMVLDGSWQATVAAGQSLTPGWNAVTFMIPTGVSAPDELGLQVDDAGGWTGRVVLDSVSW